ncbi:MAG: hypothetical protein K2P92_04895 [Bdellovibrionaceae bacterium]|nr:hypothetical protein [Pseudobdellovibrionaceae bacterium]
MKAGAVLALVVLSACGGGGGGGGGGSVGGGGGGGGGTNPPIDSGDLVRYPYETVYGDVCRSSSEPTPGCTFVRSTGLRVTVSKDPNYDKFGYGSDDLWYVKFDSTGRTAAVYNDLGVFQYNADISKFAGYVSGSTIGVGTTGAYWENVSGKTYWFGKNGVLFSANQGAANYGQAINNKDANKANDQDSFALKSQANVNLIRSGAQKLMKQYGFSASKAVAVASALNSWAVMGAERGKITETDMDKTFKTVFGVQFNEALSAFKALQAGDTAAARDLNQRSATALGLKPEQSEAFIKGMYRSALSKWGYDVDQIKW